MKLHLLHGPAINNSRIKLNSLRQGFDQNNVVVFDPSAGSTGSPQASSGQVLANLMTTALFPEEKLFILENPSEDFTNYSLTPNAYTLILWFDHTVAEKKPIIEWAKKLKGEVSFFSETREVSVFPLLDYLAAKDQKAFLEIKKLKLGGFDIFYFITMTFYLLRNLVSTPKTVPHFVRDKLQRQRKRFDLKKITNLYKDVLEIDFKLKSGLLDQPQAEFLLVSEFVR